MSGQTNKTDVDEQQVIGANAVNSQLEQEQKQTADELSRGANNALRMQVRIYSPFNDYYDGLAFSLSAVNATGPFDILPKHHNFISLLEACVLTVRTVNRGEQKIQISGGLIHVKADQVIIFLDV